MGEIAGDRRESEEEISLRAKLWASEADRAERLTVIEDLSVRLAASEADRAARLRVIEDLSVRLAASEADRADRLTAIEELSVRLAASEADRADRLTVIEELASKLASCEARASAADEPAGRERLDDALASRRDRVARWLGLRRKPASGRLLRTYSLEEFRKAAFVCRPDLADVRAYNRQMVDALASLRKIRGKTLLDIGASPHGFALERALETGVAKYCGIGLGVAGDLAVHAGQSTGVLLNMNAERLEFAANSFDAIISLSTFEHFHRPEAVLAEMHRVLKPGGAAFLNFQPVWTSLHGHHLHHLPDICRLLPPWAHLRSSREELDRLLRPNWPASASMPLREVLDWIYESDGINRLSAGVLRRALETSPLEVVWMTPLMDEVSEAEAAAARAVAEETSYPVEELKVKGYSALLAKRRRAKAHAGPD